MIKREQHTNKPQKKQRGDAEVTHHQTPNRVRPTCCSHVSGGQPTGGNFSRREELQPRLISYLSVRFSWRCISLPPPSICVHALLGSNVRHKVKHLQAARRFLMRPPCSFHAQYVSFFLPSLFKALWCSSSSLGRERSCNHQSAFGSRGLRQRPAALSVLPDTTAVTSGYPYTSSLTPVVFSFV